MFEQRKMITVNGVSFNMILVEGDRLCIGEREVELDDFYIGEIPVTQELYSAVLGPVHTASYNMMPDNFDYLNPNRGLLYSNILRVQESTDDYSRRLEKEYKEKSDRESKEQERIRRLAKSLPVNNISWFEAITFIKKLNEMTGLTFALPSFEQWYFAASGGVESKGYAFAGSDDANDVGHFHSLSTIAKSEGLYVMTEGQTPKRKRKVASEWYQTPKNYKPNELGIYDLSGLVAEWLDEPGKIIGGSFYSNPDSVSKIKLYGYSDFRYADSCLNSMYPIFSCVAPNGYSISSGNLYGLRLILQNKPKEYTIPEIPCVKSEVSDNERQFINIIAKRPNLGLTRTIIANKYVKEPTLKCREQRIAYGKFSGNIYNIFICPQNLSHFEGKCFVDFSSRRKFISYCKEEFLKVLTLLNNMGYSLLIKDNIGLNLLELASFYSFGANLNNLKLRSKKEQEWLAKMSSLDLITNNQDAVKCFIEEDLRGRSYYSLASAPNLALIEINDTLELIQKREATDNWMTYNPGLGVNKNIKLRLTLNFFCDFGHENSVDSFLWNSIYTSSSRINDIDFDNSEQINWLFCQRNKGGLYEYNYPPSSGEYFILDDKFFILPQSVYEELSQNLKNKKQ